MYCCMTSWFTSDDPSPSFTKRSPCTFTYTPMPWMECSVVP